MMRNKLEFEELSGWQEFEELVASYFRAIKQEKGITSVRVEKSGEGSDGGRDILITFRLTDSVSEFKRKWVVQCKFYKKSVSKTNLSDINIPSLIHEHKADGYLLVCRRDVTSVVSTMFENLRKNCRFKYSYEIWTGDELKNRLLPEPNLIQKYFPEYYEFTRPGKHLNLEDL